MLGRRVADGFLRVRAVARAVTLGALLAAGAAAAQSPAYKDPKLPFEQRVSDLVARMTLEEKVAQLVSVWLDKTQVFDASLGFDAAKAQAKFPNGLGTFARPSDARGAVSPRLAR